MGLFRNNTKKLVKELRAKSEYYGNDLSKEIKEQLDELRTDYEENINVVPEFKAFVEELKSKLNLQDSKKLEEFSLRLSKVNRSAKNGVEAMWELSNNQRKLTAENLREYEEFE